MIDCEAVPLFAVRQNGPAFAPFRWAVRVSLDHLGRFAGEALGSIRAGSVAQSTMLRKPLLRASGNRDSAIRRH